MGFKGCIPAGRWGAKASELLQVEGNNGYGIEGIRGCWGSGCEGCGFRVSGFQAFGANP